MKVTPDTNVLVRAAVADDPDQARLAARLLREADTVAISVPALCEFVWVLSRGYNRTASDIALAIRHLIISASVALDQPAVEAGLAMVEAGGDFADGVMAFDGRRLGGHIFASFDRRAVALTARLGGEARFLPVTSRQR